MIEAEGIRRALAEVDQAALVLYLVHGGAVSERDAAVILASAELAELLQQDGVLVVVNKVDRIGEPASASGCRT